MNHFYFLILGKNLINLSMKFLWTMEILWTISKTCWFALYVKDLLLFKSIQQMLISIRSAASLWPETHCVVQTGLLLSKAHLLCLFFLEFWDYRPWHLNLSSSECMYRALYCYWFLNINLCSQNRGFILSTTFHFCFYVCFINDFIPIYGVCLEMSVTFLTVPYSSQTIHWEI